MSSGPEQQEGAWRASSSPARLWVSGLAMALLIVVATPATGSNFGSSGSAGISGTTNGVWLTMNSNWVVGRRSMTATYSDGVERAVYD